MQHTEKKTGKIAAFFKKWYALFVAPLIVGAAYIAVLCVCGVYPFGNKYTAASYDLASQICPFIEHLFDVFDGKSKLSFSYAVVGGADLVGSLLYFFISPFSFLFLIFGDGRVAHASSIVMLCKLTAIAVAGTWFAKTLFRDIPDYLCIAIGVTYTYCGYTFVANTYINWLDFLIYLPFCTAAFKHFVKTGKFLPFSVLVACCIYTCFSIASFSLFTVYPALVAYGLLCVEKEGRNRFIAYLSLSFAVAIFMALPVLLPALGAYSVSGREGELFENLWKGFTVDKETGELGSFDSSAFLNSYGISVYRKWSYILSDSVFVILTLVWFLRKGLKDKFAQFMLIAGVLTLLPTLVDESMNLLNMGSYMSYSLRFGFLNALYLLGGACLCIEGWCYKPFTAKDGSSLLTEAPVSEENAGGRYALKAVFRKENKKPLLWAGGFILLGVLAAAFLLWYGYGDNFKGFVKLFGSNAKNFSTSYAHSLGGLDVVLVLFIVVGVVAVSGLFLVDGKRISPRLLSFVLILVVGAQLVFYNGQLVVGNRSTQHELNAAYQTLSAELNERDESYFRIKDVEEKTSACVPFTGDSNSFSVFSSVIDKKHFTTFQLFGYAGNGKNSFKSAHNDNKRNRAEEFGDAFLGYKYFFSTKADLHEEKERSYLTPVYELDGEGNPLLNDNGEPKRLTEGGLYVYENSLVLPMAYKVRGGEGYTFVAENINSRVNRKKNQKALYEYLCGSEATGDVVSGADVVSLSGYLQEKAARVEVAAGQIKAHVSAEAGENLMLGFVAVEGYAVTVNGREVELIDNDLNFLLVALDEGENEVIFTYSTPYTRYALYGLAVGVFALLLVWLLVKKTTVMDKISPVISWLGIGVATVVVAFFMLYPTGVFLAKLMELLKLVLS